MKIVFVVCCLGSLLLPEIVFAGKPPTRGSDREMRALMTIARDAARRHGVDYCLVHGLIYVESRFNANAISPKGARGAAQLMPETARELNVVWIFDGESNIDGGVRYLKQQLERFQSVRKALYAYNAGPQRVVAGKIPNESLIYADRVLRVYWRCQARSPDFDRRATR